MSNDALADQLADEAHHALRAAEHHAEEDHHGFAEGQRRERIAEYIARVEAKLATRQGRALYLDYAAQSHQLTDREFRYLYARSGRGDPDLSNCFVRRRSKIAQRLGGHTPRHRDGKMRKGLERIARLERSVSAKGWHVIDAEGTQFLIPPGVITPEHPGWPGPRRWDNRKGEA